MTKAKQPESEGEQFARQLREAMAARSMSTRGLSAALAGTMTHATIHRAMRGHEITATNYRTLLRWIGEAVK